jgi:hypothetical protein
MISAHGFEVHELRPVGRTLLAGGLDLHDTADRAPDLPDAGSSSAHVAGAFAAIARASAGIVRCADVANDRVTTAAQSYANTENDSTEAFGGHL